MNVRNQLVAIRDLARGWLAGAMGTHAVMCNIAAMAQDAIQALDLATPKDQTPGRLASEVMAEAYRGGVMAEDIDRGSNEPIVILPEVTVAKGAARLEAGPLPTSSAPSPADVFGNPEDVKAISDLAEKIGTTTNAGKALSWLDETLGSAFPAPPPPPMSDEEVEHFRQKFEAVFQGTAPVYSRLDALPIPEVGDTITLTTSERDPFGDVIAPEAIRNMAANWKPQEIRGPGGIIGVIRRVWVVAEDQVTSLRGVIDPVEEEPMPDAVVEGQP